MRPAATCRHCSSATASTSPCWTAWCGWWRWWGACWAWLSSQAFWYALWDRGAVLLLTDVFVCLSVVCGVGVSRTQRRAVAAAACRRSGVAYLVFSLTSAVVLSAANTVFVCYAEGAPSALRCCDCCMSLVVAFVVGACASCVPMCAICAYVLMGVCEQTWSVTATPASITPAQSCTTASSC